MSTPGTPERQAGDSPPADPLTVKPARRAEDYMNARSLNDEDNDDSRPASPFSFKRKSAASSPSPAFPSPGAAAAKRSLSNFFSRRASAAGRDAPTNKLSLPPTPSFGGDRQGLLSPQATPTRRVSGAARSGYGGGARKPSNARGGGYSRNLSPGAISPGGLRGRIQDWQRTSNYSPGGNAALADERSPASDAGGDDEGDEEYDDFDDSRMENEPIIPKMLPELRTPEHQTPLPKLPIVVLAIW